MVKITILTYCHTRKFQIASSKVRPPIRYSFSKDTRKELERIFISNIHAVLKARGKQGIVDYFTDASKMWLSLHLLFAIELLTKAVRFESHLRI
jgi:hypothetical protein